jgi:hypothetical protein
MCHEPGITEPQGVGSNLWEGARLDRLSGGRVLGKFFEKS